VAFDLKVFFTVVDKTPARVTSGDVMSFIARQRNGDGDLVEGAGEGEGGRVPGRHGRSVVLADTGTDRREDGQVARDRRSPTRLPVARQLDPVRRALASRCTASVESPVGISMLD